MSPEAERSFDNTYSVKRGQPFDVPRKYTLTVRSASCAFSAGNVID